MLSIDGSSPSSNHRGLRRFFCLHKHAAQRMDRGPLMSFSSHPATMGAGKSKTFASSAFSSLGCASITASQAYAPPSAAAAVRSSADWEGKRYRRRKTKLKKNDMRGHSSSSASASASTDLWCAPGIPFVTGDDSVDCLVSSRELIGRGISLGPHRVPRDRAYSGRRGFNQEETSSMVDSLSALQTSLFGSHLMPPELYHHLRGYHHRPTVELEEIMLFPHRTLLQGRDAYDRHRDWRLDVDGMTYEELLELGDRIGHVSTGLREEEVACSIRKMKHSIFFDTRSSLEMEAKCSICQEEYQMDDEVGKLRCGHGYHINCIKKWLLQKNVCPVCKTIAKKTVL